MFQNNYLKIRAPIVKQVSLPPLPYHFTRWRSFLSNWPRTLTSGTFLIPTPRPLLCLSLMAYTSQYIYISSLGGKDQLFRACKYRSHSMRRRGGARIYTRGFGPPLSPLNFYPTEPRSFDVFENSSLPQYTLDNIPRKMVRQFVKRADLRGVVASGE